jgi:hypothetical protein
MKESINYELRCTIARKNLDEYNNKWEEDRKNEERFKWIYTQYD